MPAPTLGHKSSLVSKTLAPRLRIISLVSLLAFSGITISTLYPKRLAIPVSAIPVFPDVGSMIMLFPFVKMPLSSPSLIIQYAALSFTEPNGLCPSNFAKYA